MLTLVLTGCEGFLEVKMFVLRHQRMNWGWSGWRGAGSDWPKQPVCLWFLFHS